MPAILKKWVTVTQVCLILYNIMDCSSLGSSVHGILQARVLKWVAIPFSRGSSQLRDQTCVFCRQIPYHLSHQGDLPAFLLSFNATPALGRVRIFCLLGLGDRGLFPSCFSTKLGNKPNLLTLVVVKESTVFITECQAEQATLLKRPQLLTGFPAHSQWLSGKGS